MNEIEKREETLHNWVIFHVGDGFDMTSEKRAAFRDGFDAGIAALEAERDALRADAERYRWLSAEHDRIDPLAAVVWKSSGDRHGSQWCNTINAEDLARAIDARIAAIAAKEPK